MTTRNQVDQIEKFKAAVGSWTQPGVLAERLVTWAASLESAGLARLSANEGAYWVTLRAIPRGESTSLTTIFHKPSQDAHDQDDQYALALHRSVFNRCAPKSLLPALEASLVDPAKESIWVPKIPMDLLPVLTKAYREAAETHGYLTS